MPWGIVGPDDVLSVFDLSVASIFSVFAAWRQATESEPYLPSYVDAGTIFIGF